MSESPTGESYLGHRRAHHEPSVDQQTIISGSALRRPSLLNKKFKVWYQSLPDYFPANMEPKPAYIEEDEELDINTPAVDDKPDQDDSVILEILEEDGIEIDDEDLNDEDLDDEDLENEKDSNEASTTLQHLSSVGAKAAKFITAQRRKLILFKRHMFNSEARLRDEIHLEAKLRMQEAGKLQPEISDELRHPPPPGVSRPNLHHTSRTL